VPLLDEAPSLVPAQQKLAVPASALAGLGVLVVDDDRGAREAVAAVLEQGGAEVTTAGSATEAIRILDRRPLDVLVSDIAMPACDGYAFIRRLRTAGMHGRIPAVALTACAGPEDREHALLAGFQAHVAKPAEPAELIAAIADVARRGVTAVEPGAGNALTRRAASRAPSRSAPRSAGSSCS
jgi:CheY-like chemotaxis protein